MKRPDADPILRDNRKNRPRFLVICLVCLLGGAALGYAAAALTDPAGGGTGPLCAAGGGAVSGRRVLDVPPGPGPVRRLGR